MQTNTPSITSFLDHIYSQISQLLINLQPLTYSRYYDDNILTTSWKKWKYICQILLITDER